jgi:hypothetical protein
LSIPEDDPPRPGDAAHHWVPDEALVRAIHDRWLVEVVEEMNLCPFARKSREQGRVARPILRDLHQMSSPAYSADAIAEALTTTPEVEIILLTYPVPDTHPWRAIDAFDTHVAAVRDAWAERGGTSFYMVAFHPEAREPTTRSLTADSLVPLLRRTPDPVIQCVRADMLDALRKQVQEQNRRRMIAELEAKDPHMAELFARSVQADPELGSDIARSNFEHVGAGDGRARLEAAVDALRAERDRRYGEARRAAEDGDPSPPDGSS